MPSLPSLETLVEDMSLLPDARERIAALIRWGQRAPELPAAECSDDLRVHGCISKVWLRCSVENGHCLCAIAADSPMVRGLAGVTARLVHGQAADAVAACDLDWPGRLGLDRSITPTRLNGLAAVARAMRQCATRG